MMKKILILLIVLFTLVGCSIFRDDPPKPTEEEVLLIIQLDVKEDIGLLILDASMNDTETSGGISNVDKSLLKHDETLYWTLTKQDYNSPTTPADVSIRFRIITKYFDPNYENHYPEEYTILLDPLSFQANFGETHMITITGDKDTGYKATHE